MKRSPKPINFNWDFDVKVVVSPDEYLETLKILKKHKAKCTSEHKYLKLYSCKMHVIIFTCNLKNATAIYKALQNL